MRYFIVLNHSWKEISSPRRASIPITFSVRLKLRHLLFALSWHATSYAFTSQWVFELISRITTKKLVIVKHRNFLQTTSRIWPTASCVRMRDNKDRKTIAQVAQEERFLSRRRQRLVLIPSKQNLHTYSWVHISRGLSRYASQKLNLEQFVADACGMMTYSEILAANCESTWINETQSAAEGSYIESGTWITYDSKLSNLEKPKIENPNLKNLGVEDYTSAKNLRIRDQVHAPLLRTRDSTRYR